MSATINTLTAYVLLSIGLVGGAFLAHYHYRPQLDTAQTELATALAGRDNLEELATEQGLKLGELVRLGNEREALAKKAQEAAQQEAKPHYEAANRLMVGRTGGDQCAAATAVIDQELFGL